ncbi:MAG TPA: DUF302 domain-containing protein [Solirubrobacteraceae bacterium]|jgi:uncharacterized protein (DUF302 family)|nr:DUF302 domain-containing protein [Solirubrobacteraceae bacterium]
MPLEVAQSPYPVAVTVDRLVAALGRRGATVFARIDHAGGARAVGLELPDEELLVFGDPKAGTPLMQDDPQVGYDLPLRLLVWDAGGETLVGHRPATELAALYALEGRSELLDRMSKLLEGLVGEATAL